MFLDVMAPTSPEFLFSAAKHARNEVAKHNAAGILWLEHVNLVYGSRDHTERFYFQGLGLTRDPARTFGTTIWANIGDQQFHLTTAPGDTPQVINGTIGLALPDLLALKARYGIENCLLVVVVHRCCCIFGTKVVSQEVMD